MESKPNHVVKLVFKEVINEDEGVIFMNIFLEVDGREIDMDLVKSGDITLAEQWGYETLHFIEDYMREQLAQQQMVGHVMPAPKKRDMN